MGISTLARSIRTGLVTLALVFSLLPAAPVFSQASSDGPEEEASVAVSSADAVHLSLKQLAEIESSSCRRRYSNPLNLLFLLPGVLFLLFVAATRNVKRIFPFLSLLLLMGSTGSGLVLRQAEESFAAGRYAEAKARYEQAERDFPSNSALLYNLAVVSHYSEQHGYAIHYLRRSLRLAPADQQARDALQLLEDGYGLAGQVTAPFPVHPDSAFVLLLILANATLVMGALVLRTKRVQFVISLVLLAIVTMGCLAFFLGRLLGESRSVGVVLGEQGELYRVPEEDSKSWFELPAGTSLWIRGRVERYYLVETPSQIEGWVRQDAILLD